jgi:uncharacterized membrane protein (UPF0127 family)
MWPVLGGLLLVATSSCAAGASGGREASPSPSVTFNPASVIISTEKGPVLVKADVADTEQRREIGLSGRSSVPRDAGMVFLFFKDSTRSFWMKNTTVALSIAFFDVDGKILSIQNMLPCKKDPCRRFNPGEPYRGALEVNRGAFARWDVNVGDKLTVSP